MTMNNVPARLVFMGVAGCGKTTIGQTIAERLGATFLDGDDFHPAANVAKMSAGSPLTDEDRWPWLDRLGSELEVQVKRVGRVVLACSALKRVYRDRLATPCAVAPLFVHLAGPRDVIHARMAARPGHFMPPGLLDSQFATLEQPAADENAIQAPVEASVDEVVANILARIGVQALEPRQRS